MELSNNKTKIMAVLALILISVYVFFFRKDEPTISTLDGDVSGQESLLLLSKLQNLKFGDKIMYNENYASLHDFHLPLVSLPVGKDNPFSPL